MGYIEITSANCTSCPLKAKQKFDALQTKYNRFPADILFISEFPMPDEAAKQELFGGKHGRMLQVAIKKLYNDTYAFSSVTRCCHLKEKAEVKPPNPSIVKCCKQNVLDDIKKLKPKLIVFFGMAHTHFINKAGSLSDNRGRIFRDKINDKEYDMIIMNSLYSARDTKSAVDISKHLYEDLRLAFGYNDMPDITPKPEKYTATVITSVSEFKDLTNYLLNEVPKGSILAFDTETYNLNKRYKNEIVTMQFGLDDKSGYVLPFYHQESPFSNEEKEKLKKYLRKLFTEQNPNFKYWLMHNAKFDVQRVYNSMGIVIGNRPILDTMTMYFTLDENRLIYRDSFTEKGSAFGLKGLNKFILGDMDYFEGLNEAKQAREGGLLKDMEMKKLSDYGSIDVAKTRRLFNHIMKMAIAQNFDREMMQMQIHFYSRVSFLNAMVEYNGFQIDLDKARYLMGFKSPILKGMDDVIKKLMNTKATKQANDVLNKQIGRGMQSFSANTSFSIDKPAHRKLLFFDILKLKPVSFGKTGASVDDKFFKFYENEVEEAKLLSDYVKLKKLKTSYVMPIYSFVNPNKKKEDSCTDGRLRTSINIIGTNTGRSSMSKPSIQVIPRADNEAKKEIKNMFSCPKNHCLIQLDFKTSEVRWLAILSGDPELQKAFDMGRKYLLLWRNTNKEKYKKIMEIYGDLHKATASIMFDIPIEDVDKKQRQAAKKIVFGSIYGMGLMSLAKDLGYDPDNQKDMEIVKGLSEKLWAKMKKAYDYLIHMEKFAEENHYVKSPTGRRRVLKSYFFNDYKLKSESNRLARNAPIQGISSDGAFYGSAAFNDYIFGSHLEEKWKIINIVHDSCVLEIPLTWKDLRAALAVTEYFFTTKVMDDWSLRYGINFNVPLEVEFEVGISYGNLKKWDYSDNSLKELYKNMVKENDSRRDFLKKVILH